MLTDTAFLLPAVAEFVVVHTHPAEEVELAPGDRVVFDTDGLIEVFNRSGDMLGVEDLKRLSVNRRCELFPK